MLLRPFLQAAALALSFLTVPAFAQEAAPAAPATQDADPALWVVKDADTTIYLFGTVHALKPGLSWFDEAVRKAFDASGELVTEIGATPDPAEMQPLIIKYGLNMTGPSLTERLPEDKRALFAKTVADLGLPAAVIDRFDPWLAAVQMTMMAIQKHGYDGKNGVEEALNAAAKAENKPVSGLETVDEQLRIFDSLSEDAQIKYLIETMETIADAGTMLDKMVAEWGKGDADGLAALMNEDVESSPEIAKALLADRNARWAAWIETRLAKPGVVFLAVGAGHLAGPESVQMFLKQRKIETSRIAY
ncbi:TraB/GumN family protein [Sphingomonas sp.]|uniref:TraB/GumN family protein n=1 Tax=Sphingomonas sp. TaxID=28214 RepID=UPI001ECA9D31|nr:TraB/GumN family protein [Sphingomonas sp.]MBX3595261.1 TraB/GumN family protein [Sphingomonas sp.]